MALKRNDHHAYSRIPKHIAKLLFARSQRVLGLLAFGDVLSRPAKQRDLTGSIAQHFASIDDPSCAAIRPNHLEIELVRRSEERRVGKECRSRLWRDH